MPFRMNDRLKIKITKHSIVSLSVVRLTDRVLAAHYEAENKNQMINGMLSVV